MGHTRDTISTFPMQFDKFKIDIYFFFNLTSYTKGFSAKQHFISIRFIIKSK